MRTQKTENIEIVQKFGGGIHSRASEEDIKDRESFTGGQNARLDPDNRELRPRLPFDLLDTTPDGNEISGMVNLLKSDGTSQIAVITTGGNVYEYSSGSFGSAIATGLSTTAKMRGRIEHNWAIDDIVIITDLNLSEEIYTWDGTSSGFSKMTHNLTGDFRAKYCFISSERAWYGGVYNNGTSTPHAVIASGVDDYDNLSTSKATGSTGDGDPFWLLMPDLRPINGMVEAYGRRVFSTKDGQIFDLSGSVASDFTIEDFYPRSGVSGDEALTYIGDDIVYGRRGRIESLRATDQFGDVSANDLSFEIDDLISTFINWTIVYNQRTQEFLCIPENQSQAWNYSKAVKEQGQYSPWMKYVTNHSFGFNVTCAMNMIDPEDGLEYIFMGDSSGNFYRLEGTASNGDAGTENIKTVFVSQMKTLPATGTLGDFDGYIRYRKDQAYNVDLSFLFGGRKSRDETLQIQIEGAQGGVYYGGTNYYGQEVYYGQGFSGRLLEKYIGQAGQGENFQIRVEIETKADFRINEVGFRAQAVIT